ncbi:hypothetical protein Cadr_000012396 [Camelus dromedarius]|uniref:Uncharacterized protein n=1 Tax=Camelus dromedarius TaxID=9838 RepID=A0A5N4DU00_CAMDR|nr:hypothetical protein Cadr_000012396 [Camelus dromedarius]
MPHSTSLHSVPLCPLTLSETPLYVLQPSHGDLIPTTPFFMVSSGSTNKGQKIHPQSPSALPWRSQAPMQIRPILTGADFCHPAVPTEAANRRLMHTKGTCQVIEVRWLLSQKLAVIPHATQLLKASHCLLPPGCVLGCARSSFQMLLSSAPLWSETSHTEQEASHGQRLSHIPIPLCPFSRPGSEGFPTQAALIGTFSSVDFPVLIQARAVLLGGISTCWAPGGSLFGVSYEVVKERKGLQEGLPAVSALERLLCGVDSLLPPCTQCSCLASPPCGWPDTGGGLRWQGLPSQMPHTERASLIGGLCSSPSAWEGLPHPAVYTDNLRQKSQSLRSELEGGGTCITNACWTHPERSPPNCQEAAGKVWRKKGCPRKTHQGRGHKDRRSAGSRVRVPTSLLCKGFQQGLSC